MFVLAGADSLACLVLFWWPIDFPMGNRTIAIPTYLRGVFFAPLLQGLDMVQYIPKHIMAFLCEE